jgi:hypothetical protein
MSSWTLDPKKFAFKTKEDYAEVVAKVGMQVLTNLVYTTPVDTGRARSNWIASVGAPSSQKRSVRGISEVLLEAQAVFDPQQLGNFPTLYIANNLDYVVYLNQGSSQQAPANFVEAAVASVI